MATRFDSNQRRAHLLIPLFVAFLVGACRRSPEDWAEDLASPDEYARRTAALALRSVPDERIADAERALLAVLDDRAAGVREASRASLEHLAQRNIDGLLTALGGRAGRREDRRTFLIELLAGVAAEQEMSMLDVLLDPLHPAREAVAKALEKGAPEAALRARAQLENNGLALPAAWDE